MGKILPEDSSYWLIPWSAMGIGLIGESGPLKDKIASSPWFLGVVSVTFVDDSHTASPCAVLRLRPPR